MAETLFRPVNSFENARIKAEQEKAADAKLDEPEPPADEPKGENLPQSDAPEGGESERSDKPEDEAPAAEPAKPAERFVPGAMTPEEFEATAKRIVEAAREEIESRNEPEPAPEVPHGTQTDEALPYAAKKHLAVLNEMAAANPAFKELPKRQREFWKKEEKYIDQWAQANQGAQFDPQSPDHAEFYRKNQPFVPEEEFDSAKEALITRAAEERAVARVRKEQEPRIREMELKEREREAAPHIGNSMADAAESVFAAVPQFKDTFEATKLTAAAVAKMEEINKPLARIAREEAEVTAVLVGELEKLDRFQGHYQVNPAMRHRLSNGQVIQPHAILEAEFAEAEAALLAKPEVRDGKKLISFDKAMERAQRIQADPKLRPDQKARAIEDLHKSYWWATTPDVVKHIKAKKAARVAEFAEAFPKSDKPQAEITATNGTPKPAPAAKPVTPAKPSGKAGLARGTSTASASDVADNAPKSRNELEKAMEYLEKRLFR